MQTFQLVHNGKRIARLHVNCSCSSQEIAEALFGASVAFKVAHRHQEIDQERYCGMKEWGYTVKGSGAKVEIYHIEEGGEVNGEETQETPEV